MFGGYAELLYQIGLLDEKQKAFFRQQTDLAVIYIQQKKWREAFEVRIRGPHAGLQQLKPSEESKGVRRKRNGGHKLRAGERCPFILQQKGKEREN